MKRTRIITLEGIKYAEFQRSARQGCIGCDLNSDETEGCGVDIYGQEDTISCGDLDSDERDLLQCGPGRNVIYKRCYAEEQEEEFFQFTPHGEKLFTPVK